MHALSASIDLDVADTTHRTHATDLARQARRDGMDVVLTLGGDGTVNEVVNGLLADGPGHDVPRAGHRAGRQRQRVRAQRRACPRTPSRRPAR